MPLRPIKYLGTIKGDILSLIINIGVGDLEGILEYKSMSMDYEEYTKSEIKQAFDELVKDGELFLNPGGYYDAIPQLVEDYEYYWQNWPDYLEPPYYDDDFPEPEITLHGIVKSATAWVELQEPKIILKSEQCYLEGHYLDSFIRFIFTRAEKTIIAVSPFFDLSSHIQLLIKAKQNGKTAVLLTRPPTGPYFKKLHQILADKGLKLLYHNDLHAKLIVVDDLLAVVSSMNFKQRAAAGITWEAGLVTMNKEIVDSIISSLADLDPKPSYL
jgi:hypothetical protein